MSRETTYNFAPGPSALPTEVLETAAAEMLDYHGAGLSVMEMSHRSSAYLDIFNEVKADLKKMLDVPDTHEILFLQGGATLQFAMIPMNLMGEGGSADYAVTGNFAKNAKNEAMKYGAVNIAADTSDTNHDRIPAQSELKLDPNAKYFYYCANNTIFGTEWKYIPDTGEVPLVCDMSSNILSKPVDVSRYGLIYAGAQKNMAPAGLTVVIIRRDLAGHALSGTPIMLDYATQIKGDSMYNTPPGWCIYILGLTLQWAIEGGGLAAMEQRNVEKAALLYEYLDESKLFRPVARKEARSVMNVTFRTDDKDLDAQFAKEAAAAGLSNLKGHRLVGGMRASIYNAMPMEGVRALREFMAKFEKEHI